MDQTCSPAMFSGSQRPSFQSTLARAGDGDVDAQFSLGLKFANSEGEAQDYVRAAQWYLKAAHQNHSLAQFNLGLMYESGQGVARNDAEAVTWIRKAAEQGDAGAQFNLGTRYQRSSISGLEMDAVESRIESYKWFQLAAAQGYKGSVVAWKGMTLSMTREDVTEGNHRTAAFAAGPRPPQAKRP